MKINRRMIQVKKIVFLGLIALLIFPSFVFLIKNSMNTAKAKTVSSLKIDSIEFNFDNIYSIELTLAIKNYVADYVAMYDNFFSVDQQKLYQSLCEKFNVIKSFDCRIGDKSNLIVSIVGQQPVCFINKDKLLSDANKLLSPALFQSFDCTNLFNINIKNLDQVSLNGLLNAELCDFIRKITDQHKQMFDIDYVNPSEIRLYPKNISIRCILLSSERTFFDFNKINETLDLCQKVASDKGLQKKIKYTSKKHLILDLRFKSSIVARAESELKEGEYEEKVIQ